MRVLIIGSGGREHCLAWKLASSPKVEEVLVAPGNAGTALCAKNVAVNAEDISGLRDLAFRERVDLVVVGPEAPLTLGLVDLLTEDGIPAFGPSRYAAQLEGSKSFSKDIMKEYGIPTAEFGTFTDFESANDYLVKQYASGKSFVIKADGLAAGKGVIVPDTLDEAQSALRQVMLEGLVGDAGKKVVLEERLVGEEVSLLALSDGETVVPLLPAQDHKRIGEGDTGPNTGGMGAYSPVPKFDKAFIDEVVRTVLQPTIRAMKEKGHPYKGVLYAGIMVCNGKPFVLEYNVRFGDPETQVILPLLESDLVELALHCVNGTLKPEKVRWRDGAAITVVLASKGYPGGYEKGKAILGLEDATNMEDLEVFHAGTALKDGVVNTSGGRVLNVVGIGKDLKSASEKAYTGIEKIHFDGMTFRRDIGWRAFA